jgi:nucleotide-binding universal stress UspA family protein
MTLSRIVVGVDFSAESERAVDHAIEVARGVGGGLTLVHVGTVPEPIGAGWGDDAWREAIEARFGDALARLAAVRDRLSGRGVEVSHVVVDGFPDTGLADTARDLVADLIVVGTLGRTGFRRLLVGSVAEKTVRLADASVLVTRGDAVPGGYRRIVVGTDYSPLAWCAVERALELAAPGAEVRIIHAWSAPYVAYELTGWVLDQLRDAAEAEAAEHRERAVAMAAPAGATVTLELVDSAPVAALEALSESSDLVVVGSHGRRGVRRLLVGSVAEATVRHARCTVLVAR